jgi:hypothetical protein
MNTADHTTTIWPYSTLSSSCEATAKYVYVIRPLTPTPTESSEAARP